MRPLRTSILVPSVHGGVGAREVRWERGRRIASGLLQVHNSSGHPVPVPGFGGTIADSADERHDKTAVYAAGPVIDRYKTFFLNFEFTRGEASTSPGQSEDASPQPLHLKADIRRLFARHPDVLPPSTDFLRRSPMFGVKLSAPHPSFTGADHEEANVVDADTLTGLRRAKCPCLGHRSCMSSLSRERTSTETTLLNEPFSSELISTSARSAWGGVHFQFRAPIRRRRG